MNDPSTADATFVYETYIRSSIAAVWAALTQAEFTREYWSGTEIRSTWNIGDPVQMFMADGRLGDSGEVLACEPPRLLVYTFQPQWDEALAKLRVSRVRFELEELGADVKLRLIHDQLEADSVMHIGISEGWPKILASLKSLLETGAALDIGSPAARAAAEQKVLASIEARGLRE